MKKPKILLILLLTLLVSSCYSTKITSSWAQPNKKVKISELNKVLVVALLQNETSRRKAEDQMVKYLKGKGVVSYKYLDDNFNKKNEEAIKQLIKTDNFDAAITMRLVDIDNEQIYYPSSKTDNFLTFNDNFIGYIFQNYPNYNQKGYYLATKIYTVEIIIFSILQDKIIWKGLTKSTNNNELVKITDEISKVVYKKMRRQGFLGKN
jgi:hypothetical protein